MSSARGIQSHTELIALVEAGVISPVEDSAINSSSIDIHLGDTILTESTHPYAKFTVNLEKKERLDVARFTFDSRHKEFCLHPGEFILAQSREVFNLPLDISAEYKLKSSMARVGLEHLNAGWCDAGWNGSVLTLELKNMTRNHVIILTPGAPIGQVVFFKHTPVDRDRSYAVRGRYNGDLSVTGTKRS